MPVRLHVNVDHVATLRQARGTAYPDPVEAAASCERAGAHGVTVHLREDRRHIQDADVRALRASVTTLLNLEMAATEEMEGVAAELRPDVVTLVPEKREERTTEGGLDVRAGEAAIARIRERLGGAGVRLSLFVDPDPEVVRASVGLGVDAVELHTGDYANAADEAGVERELGRLARAAALARELSPTLTVAAGHGLTATNVAPLVARLPEVAELNIGHALVADAVFEGLGAAVRRYLDAIAVGEGARAAGGAAG